MNTFATVALLAFWSILFFASSFVVTTSVSVGEDHFLAESVASTVTEEGVYFDVQLVSTLTLSQQMELIGQEGQKALAIHKPSGLIAANDVDYVSFSDPTQTGTLIRLLVSSPDSVILHR